jgi:hypothetical protein
MARLQQTDHRTGPDEGSGRDGGPHRLVGRPQPVVVIHRHHASAADRPGEDDGAAARREHGPAGRAHEVDAAVAGSERVRRGPEPRPERGRRQEWPGVPRPGCGNAGPGRGRRRLVRPGRGIGRCVGWRWFRQGWSRRRHPCEPERRVLLPAGFGAGMPDLSGLPPHDLPPGLDRLRRDRGCFRRCRERGCVWRRRGCGRVRRCRDREERRGRDRRGETSAGPPRGAPRGRPPVGGCVPVHGARVAPPAGVGERMAGSVDGAGPRWTAVGRAGRRPRPAAYTRSAPRQRRGDFARARTRIERERWTGGPGSARVRPPVPRQGGAADRRSAKPRAWPQGGCARTRGEHRPWPSSP